MGFANHSSDPGYAALVSGIVDDISVALTRFSALYVVSYLDSPAANSNDRAVPPSVRYRLEGAVRSDGALLRVTARLIENPSGQLLWAENFDGNAENVFDLHDRIALRVASHIDSTIERTEMHRAALRPAQTADGHALYWRANALFRRWDQAAIEEAIELTDRLLEIEPDSCWALALGGFCRAAAAAAWPDGDPEPLAAEAIARCTAAAARAPNDAQVTGFAAGAFLLLGHDLSSAGEYAERTLALHPGSALALFWNAWIDLSRGELARAEQRFSLSRELSPQSAAGGFTLAGLGLCRLLGGDPANALPLLRNAARRAPRYVATQIGLCVCLCETGQMDEAEEMVPTLPASAAIDRFVGIFERPEHRDRLSGGLAAVRSAARAHSAGVDENRS